MLIFKNSADYVDSCKTNREKIAAIEAIQNELLMTVMAKAGSNGDISQYSLNDGKTIIQTTYRTAKDVMASYEALEVVRLKLKQRITGRMIRLVDKDTFNGSGCH